MQFVPSENRSVARDEHNLDYYVLPVAVVRSRRRLSRWNWSNGLALHLNPEHPLDWPTIEKIKSIISQVYKHAQRHGLIPAGPTHVELARCKTT